MERGLHEFFEEQALRTSESAGAVYMVRSIGAIVYILGILKAGGAYMTVDKAVSKDRSIFLIRDSGAGIVMADGILRTVNL